MTSSINYVRIVFLNLSPMRSTSKRSLKSIPYMPCNPLLVSFQIQLARITQTLSPKPHAPGEKKPHADTLPQRKA